MTDPKEELLALIDRLDPERQAILLQYAHGLEQAGPLLEKWVEEFKIAEKHRQHERDLDLLDTSLSSILDCLDIPPEEFLVIIANEVVQRLITIRGYTDILHKEPKLASIDLIPPGEFPKDFDTSGLTVRNFLKIIFDNAEYAIHLNHLPPIYFQYRYRKQHQVDSNEPK